MRLAFALFLLLALAACGPAPEEPPPPTPTPIPEHAYIKERRPEFSAAVAPFWFWNGPMDDATVTRQLQEMRDGGVGGAVIHARKGLDVPYLSEEWFRLVGVALDTAADLNMELWIYDEDNWPSGPVGGRLLAESPELQARHLRLHALPVPPGARTVLTPDYNGSLQAVVFARLENNRIAETYAHQGAMPGPGEEILANLGPGEWTVGYFAMVKDTWKPEYGDYLYVDVMHKDFSRRFIDLTHKEYYKRFKPHFGRTLKGFFTDEPGSYCNFGPHSTGTLPWTPDMLEMFEQSMGYSLDRYLPYLWMEGVQPMPHIRYDWNLLRTQLYRDRYWEPLARWCEERFVQLTGHVFIEEDLASMVRMQGDYFRIMEPVHVPGIDDIIEADFRRITPRLAVSAAAIYGRTGIMAEVFGGYGWDTTAHEVRQGIGWMQSLGVNLIVPHAFFGFIDNDTREDYPPSLFTDNPQWSHLSETYREAQQISELLRETQWEPQLSVLYPIEGAWCVNFPQDDTSVKELDKDFKKIVATLEDAGFSPLLMNEHTLRRANFEEYGLGRIALRFSRRVGRIEGIVLPSRMHLQSDTVEVLSAFMDRGGLVLTPGRPEWEVAAASPDAVTLQNLADLRAGVWPLYGGWENRLRQRIPPPVIAIGGDLEDVRITHYSRKDESIAMLANARLPQPGPLPLQRQTLVTAQAPAGKELSFRNEAALLQHTASPNGRNLALAAMDTTAMIIASKNGTKTSDFLNRLLEAPIARHGLQDPLRRVLYESSSAKTRRILLKGTWQLEVDGETFVLDRPQGWQRLKPQFSGEGVYRYNIDDELKLFGEISGFIDLGTVREVATVILDGEPVEAHPVFPHFFPIESTEIRGILEVRVANTPANAQTEESPPSGLLETPTLSVITDFLESSELLWEQAHLAGSETVKISFVPGTQYPEQCRMLPSGALTQVENLEATFTNLRPGGYQYQWLWSDHNGSLVESSLRTFVVPPQTSPRLGGILPGEGERVLTAYAPFHEGTLPVQLAGLTFLQLKDDGTGGDSAPGDHIFTGTFPVLPPSTPGEWLLTIGRRNQWPSLNVGE